MVIEHLTTEQIAKLVVGNKKFEDSQDVFELMYRFLAQIYSTPFSVEDMVHVVSHFPADSQCEEHSKSLQAAGLSVVTDRLIYALVHPEDSDGGLYNVSAANFVEFATTFLYFFPYQSMVLLDFQRLP